uniref:DUF38 domain-containing protein n=1 Tax=Panagrolaimus davidi TaxID=227884 RepID=A0A914PB93_9BILA
MDTPESDGPATSLSTLKRKRSVSGGSSAVIPAKRLCFIAPNRRYDFDFPDSVIYYIAKNPTSAKLYKKSVEACRYFFWKNPILFVDFLVYKNNEMKADFSESEHDICLKNVPYKFWVNLTLQNQELTTDEFLFVTAKTRRVCFIDLTVVNRDGKEIAFEKLVELIPEVYSMEYYFKNNDKTITAKSVKELLKLPQLQNFIEFRLFYVPEALDIQIFFAHIKKSRGMFQFEFAGALSVAYQSRLETIIDEIIETQTFDYIPPFIYYPEMGDEKSHELYEVCRENDFWR